MALIDCPECAASVSDKAVNCPFCGYPIHKPSPLLAPSASSSPTPPVLRISKSRGLYIILGLLFGGFGFHNFYSGHNLSGGIKIGLVLVVALADASTGFRSAFSLVLLAIFVVWALIEVMTV